MKMKTLALACALAVCSAAAAAAFTPVIPVHPTVPAVVLAPTYRGLGLGQSGVPNGAALAELLANPDNWPTLLAYKPLIQEAEQHVGSIATMAPIMARIKALGLTFGVESSPITAANVARGGDIGSRAYIASSAVYNRIAASGGVLSQVALNDPLAIGQSLGMTRTAVIQQVAMFIALVQAHYPQAAVGYDDTFPLLHSAAIIADINDMQTELHNLGSRGLDYVRIDFAWDIMLMGKGPGGTFADLKVVSDYCDSIGLPFSVTADTTDYYDVAVKNTGLPPTAADDIFYEQGMQMFAENINATNAWRPRQLDFQDWTGAPTVTADETNPESYAGTTMATIRTIWP